MIFYRSLINNKKIIGFIFLLFLGANFILPQIAKAEGMTGAEFGENWWAPTEEDSGCKDNLSWYKSIAAGIADILLWAPKQIAYWVTGLADWVISTVIGWPITNPDAATTDTGKAGAQAFLEGWRSVRDLGNMLIVLGFVIIGIATTLRIRDYEAKKLLLPLIMVALLINFSGLLCGLIIDASNLTMKGLTESGVPGGMGNNFYNSMEGAETTITCQAMNDNNLSKYVMANVLYGLIYLAIAFCFSYLSIILIARYVILGILFVLSPLAFAFWAFPFPKAKDLWNNWWSHFLKWSFVGVSICFFLYIAGQMNENFPGLTGSVAGTEGGHTTTMTTIMYLSIVLITIIVGIKVSAKSNGIASMASHAVMGVVTGGAGLAMGAALGGGKMLGRGADAATGGRISSAAQSVTGGVGRTMERMGLRKEGTTGLKEGAKIAEEKKRYEAMFNSGNEGDKARAGQAARTGRGIHKAAANAAAVSTKNINDVYKDPNTGAVDSDAMHRGLAFTEKFGAGENVRKEAQKQNWQLGGADEKNVRKELVASGVAPDAAAAAAIPIGSAQYNRARSGVNLKSVEKNWKDMDTEQKAKVDLSEFHPDDALTLMTGEHGADLIKATRSLSATDPIRMNNKRVLMGTFNPATGRNDGGIIGEQVGSNQSDLSTVANGYAGTTKHIDEALNTAIDAGDSEAQKKWRKLRNEGRKI